MAIKASAWSRAACAAASISARSAGAGEYVGSSDGRGQRAAEGEQVVGQGSRLRRGGDGPAGQGVEAGERSIVPHLEVWFVAEAAEGGREVCADHGEDAADEVGGHPFIAIGAKLADCALKLCGGCHGEHAKPLRCAGMREGEHLRNQIVEAVPDQRLNFRLRCFAVEVADGLRGPTLDKRDYEPIPVGKVRVGLGPDRRPRLGLNANIVVLGVEDEPPARWPASIRKGSPKRTGRGCDADGP